MEEWAQQAALAKSEALSELRECKLQLQRSRSGRGGGEELSAERCVAEGGRVIFSSSESSDVSDTDDRQGRSALAPSRAPLFLRREFAFVVPAGGVWVVPVTATPPLSSLLPSGSISDLSDGNVRVLRWSFVVIGGGADVSFTIVSGRAPNSYTSDPSSVFPPILSRRIVVGADEGEVTVGDYNEMRVCFGNEFGWIKPKTVKIEYLELVEQGIDE